MVKFRMQYSNLNGHLYSMKIIDSPASSCGFVNENEFHFLLVCPLYNRLSHTSKCFGAHSTFYPKNPVIWK